MTSAHSWCMVDFGTILVPLDLEHPSATALNHARALALRHGSAVLVACVIEQPKLLRAAENELRRLVATKLQGVRASTLVLRGDPRRVIPLLVEREGVKLIVAHPRAPIGSVMTAMLAIPVPVWSCARAKPFDDGFDVRSIACGVDFTAHDAPVIRWTTALAEDLGARVTLAHAAPSATHMRHVPDLPLGAGAFIGTGDDVAAVLDDAASKTSADLLVIGRRPASGTGGGHCLPISQRAHVPVLSVPT